MKGNLVTRLPAAMMAFLNATVFLLPVSSEPVPVVSATSKWLADTNCALPRITSTLRALAMPAKPPVNLPMTFSL